MSERGRSLSAPPERTEDEVTLSSAEAETLHEGLLWLPMPLASEEFNARLNRAIRAGHDFRPFPAQISTRLRWMFVPALLGFALTWGMAQAGVGYAEEEAPTAPTIPHTVPPPPLPPLKLQLIPAPRHAAASAGTPGSQVQTGTMKGARR